MKNLFLIFSLLFLPLLSKADTRVRRVAVIGDQIVTVHTAIGIATIIQVPDRPNSVVVGDQDSFKVEYLDQAITIKPILGGAKSNLYVYTDWKRYNVQLISGGEAAADYVVYLENPKTEAKESKNSNIAWTALKNSLRNDTITLELNRLGRAKDGILLIEFICRGKIREELKPEWFWVTQGGNTRPIQNLFLSSVDLRPSISVSGVIQLKRDDFDSSVPIRIELRRKKISFLTIQKVGAWK